MSTIADMPEARLLRSVGLRTAKINYTDKPFSFPFYCPLHIRETGHAPSRFDYSMTLEQSFDGHGMIVPRSWNNQHAHMCRGLQPNKTA